MEIMFILLNQKQYIFFFFGLSFITNSGVQLNERVQLAGG
uniref:Uncharacterized protein n=1 Tax=Rhizophora mucronata TaxID=61149 RepID=A0A2P2N4R5_RHIMU